jgi:hypothetical protein
MFFCSERNLVFQKKNLFFKFVGKTFGEKTFGFGISARKNCWIINYQIIERGRPETDVGKKIYFIYLFN